MTALSWDAKNQIAWSNVSQVVYIAFWYPDGVWGGDTCGCIDDRCIGYHHEAWEDCGCIRALLTIHRTELEHAMQDRRLEVKARRAAAVEERRARRRESVAAGAAARRGMGR